MTYTPAPATARNDGWLCCPDMTHLTAMTAAHAIGRLVDWQPGEAAGSNEVR